MGNRIVHCSTPVLDSTLERVRGILNLSNSSTVSVYRSMYVTLLDGMSIDAEVIVRRDPVHGPPRYKGSDWTDMQVMLAECAEQVAAESVVRLFNLVANRLGAAGELPTGYKRGARHG